jgi:hypothetical protein
LVQLVDGALRLATLRAGRVRLALLPLLTGLALLILLALLLLPLLLLLLRELLLHLLELPLELLGLAAQGLLLPALAIRQAVATARAISELLLPPRQLLQLGDSLVDLLLLRLVLVAERNGRLGLVLVLLEIHLELEQLAQVAAGRTAAATAALLEGT